MYAVRIISLIVGVNLVAISYWENSFWVSCLSGAVLGLYVMLTDHNK